MRGWLNRARLFLYIHSRPGVTHGRQGGFVPPIKFGFYKKYFFSKCTSDQLNISWTFLSSLLCGFAVALLLQPPKSDDKNGQEIFKKCSTDQTFIRKRNTAFEIGTLTYDRLINPTWFKSIPTGLLRREPETFVGSRPLWRYVNRHFLASLLG